MTYAKFLSSTRLIPYAGQSILLGRQRVVNPTPEMLMRAGYLPVKIGILRPGDASQTVYSTDGNTIFVHTIEKERK